MSITIADHIRDIPRSGIRDFFEIVQSMDDVISLGIGEPDFAKLHALLEQKLGET